MSEQSGGSHNQDPHFLEPRPEDIARITDWMDDQLKDIHDGPIRQVGNFELHGHEFFVHRRKDGFLKGGKLYELTAAESLAQIFETRDGEIDEPMSAEGHDILAEMAHEQEQTYDLPEIHITTAQGRTLGFKLFSDGSIRYESLSLPGDPDFDDLEDDIASKRLGLNSLNYAQAWALHILLETLHSYQLELRGRPATHDFPASPNVVDVFIGALTDSTFAEKFAQKHLAHKATEAPTAAMIQKVESSFAKVLDLEGTWFNRSFDGEIAGKNAKVRILKQHRITESKDGPQLNGPRCYDMKITQKFPASQDFAPGEQLPEIVTTTVRINEFDEEDLTYTKLIQTDVQALEEVMESVMSEMQTITQALEVDPDSEQLQARQLELSQLHIDLSDLYGQESTKNKELEYAARRESFEGAYSMSQADADEIIKLCIG